MASGQKRIVFTGGSGKAGRHVIPELIKKGYKVSDMRLVIMTYYILTKIRLGLELGPRRVSRPQSRRLYTQDRPYERGSGLQCLDNAFPSFWL